MTTSLGVDELEEQFTAEADAAWARGVAEYRSGPSEPFRGDARHEVAGEAVDIRNYALEAGRQGRATDEEVREVVAMAFALYQWANRP